MKNSNFIAHYLKNLFKSIGEKLYIFPVRPLKQLFQYIGKKNKSFFEKIKKRFFTNPLNKLIWGSKPNRNYYLSTWFKLATVVIGSVVAVWQLPDILWGKKINEYLNLIFNGKGTGDTVGNTVTVGIFFIICVISILVTRVISRHKIDDYLHKTVIQDDCPGTSLELRVADSYITNAFTNYPKCAMMLGVNKAFIFEQSEKKSLVYDMCEMLWKEYKIDKHNLQEQIDAALKKIPASFIDSNRPKVRVRCLVPLNEEESKKYKSLKKALDDANEIYGFFPRKDEEQNIKEAEQALNNFLKEMGTIQEPEYFQSTYKIGSREVNNYKIGTIVGVDLKSNIPEKPLFKKLFMIANSEVVQGQDKTEPFVVDRDRHASTVENFYKIWNYFDNDDEMTTLPPDNNLCVPLLIPLIGGGVANEGYSDLEIFSNIVDLYFESLRESMKKNEKPHIARLIINIRDNTAIKIESDTNFERKIDLDSAFKYMEHRAQVRPVPKAIENVSQQASVPRERRVNRIWRLGIRESRARRRR